MVKLPQTLDAVLMAKLNRAGGCIGFDEYMQTVLYHPQYGYYAAKPEIIGSTADFITAPEISPLFGMSVANFCRAQLTQFTRPSILEFGAGNGTLAAGLLSALDPTTYEKLYLCEISPNLRQRQRNYLMQHCPELFHRVEWVDTPPQDFCGLIIANEVLDAMPVKCFQRQGDQLYELAVASVNRRYSWTRVAANGELLSAITKRIEQYHIPTDFYQSEWSAFLAPWFAQVTSPIKEAVMLLIDYGFSGHEYYHPTRSYGTLMCHARQQSHPDPFYLPGTQDITAHVDFSYVADVADAEQWGIAAYMTQAAFLLGNGILETLQANTTPAAQQAVKQLTLPHEMGELFKAMVLTYQADYLEDSSPLPSLLNRL